VIVVDDVDHIQGVVQSANAILVLIAERLGRLV
jgi:hypothetical protein